MLSDMSLPGTKSHTKPEPHPATVLFKVASNYRYIVSDALRAEVEALMARTPPVPAKALLRCDHLDMFVARVSEIECIFSQYHQLVDGSLLGVRTPPVDTRTLPIRPVLVFTEEMRIAGADLNESALICWGRGDAIDAVQSMFVNATLADMTLTSTIH